MKWVAISILTLLGLGRIYFFFKTRSLFDSYKGKEPLSLIIYRSVLGTILFFVTAIYVFDRAKLWMVHRLPPVVNCLGVSLGIFYLILIFWAHIVLGDNYSPSIGKAHRLDKEGPYGVIRHPIYIGHILLFLSIYLIAGWWLLTLISELIMLSLVLWRLPLEENFLERVFQDEYRDYATKVSRFLPKIF